MRFVATADIHLHPFRQCSVDAGRDRLEDGLSALEQTLAAAERHDCPWVFLGDLKHVKSVWYQYALNRAQEIFSKFRAVRKILVHGNHDGTAGGSGLLPLLSETAKVCDRPEFIKSSDLTAAVWPHGSNPETLLDFLAKAEKDGYRLLLGHIFMANAVVGTKDTPIVKGASLHEFGLAGAAGRGPTFDWAVLGDVHKQQVVAGSGPEHGNATVIYPGSPLAINWGELETDKGVLLVEVGKGPELKVTPIPVKAPRFRVVDLTGSDKPSPQTVRSWAGDFVRVFVGPQWGRQSIEALRKSADARWFEVVVRRPPKPAETRAEIHAGLSRRELLVRYMHARTPEIMDPPTLLNVGLKLSGEEALRIATGKP